jgi:hypothetical protein
MTILILVILAAVATGFLYWKVPAVKNFTDSKLSKKKPEDVPHVSTNVPIVSDPVTPPVLYNPFPGWHNEGVSLYDIIVYRLHRGLTPLEMSQAREAGYIVDTPKPGPGVNRATFDLQGSDGDGWYTLNKHDDGRPYTYTYTIRKGSTSAEIYVFAGEGTELYEVNGAKVIERAVIAVPATPGSHSITLATQSSGSKTIAVQLRQS